MAILYVMFVMDAKSDDAKRWEFVEERLSIGVPIVRIAADLGVSRQTVYNLIARSKKNAPAAESARGGFAPTEPPVETREG